MSDRWSHTRAVQYTFINALRAVVGATPKAQLPLYETPLDEDEKRWANHPDAKARDY